VFPRRHGAPGLALERSAYTRSLVRVVSVLLVSLALAAAAAAGAGAAPTARIQVTPASGGSQTVFVLRFRAPSRTGVMGRMRRFDLLGAAAPRGAVKGGCLATITVPLAAAKKGSRVRVTLDPHKLGAHWCAGTYHGQIEELEGPVCPRGAVCPAFVRLIGTIGRFALTVRAPPLPPPSGLDTTPPTFSGVQSAFACTPGPQRPGQTTPFTLSWQAASDDLTPSAQIVYDVYLASKPGGESFATPSWTTPPGTTTFRTPGLPSHGSFYFVVRARDGAGNEDHNTIEVHGSDPCL
jgi:hypothetical protein